MSNESVNGNPNENLSIPQWINEDYFHDIIEKDVPDLKKIINFKAVAAIGPGENFTSTMVRVYIDVKLKDESTKQLSYILKTMLENSIGGDLVNSMNLFPKEKKVYQTILPQFEKLYRDVGEEVTFGPKCIYNEETPEKITLVMEDLSRREFKNVYRIEGLDNQHMRHVLQKLAKFHAVSAVWNERYGPFGEEFHKSFFSNSNKKFFKDLLEKRDEIYARAMLEWGFEDPEYYISKLPSVDVYCDKAMESNSVDPTEFNVLNHGDCWCNNIMFKYKKDGTIEETLFVDFQVCKWGSPAQDLWYLIAGSAAGNIKIKEFDSFIQIYHKHLIECLELLRYSKKMPRLMDLQIMILRHGFWGYLTATGVMTMILLEPDKDANIDMMMQPGEEGDNFRYKAYANPLYGKAMCELLPFLDRRGLLDF